MRLEYIQADLADSTMFAQDAPHDSPSTRITVTERKRDVRSLAAANISPECVAFTGMFYMMNGLLTVTAVNIP